MTQVSAYLYLLYITTASSAASRHIESLTGLSDFAPSTEFSAFPPPVEPTQLPEPEPSIPRHQSAVGSYLHR
ncbi:hypothetical protein GGR54DRAFT_609752 [Hypoxylon sp. NC1633]|nr:hypothetical protein GGR54DRAFT_609752 [Hypoxylon sp. NC1633]